MSHSFNNLLSKRAILSDYTGPSVTELAATVTQLVTQSIDWSHLVTDLDLSWDTNTLVNHVSDLIKYRPGFKGYNVTEVLESYIIRECQTKIKDADIERVRLLADLVTRLRSEGLVDLHNVKELVMTITDPEISLLLHNSGLVNIVAQWRHCPPRYLDTLVTGHCATGSSVVRGLVRAAVTVEDKRVAAIMSKLVVLCCDKMTETWSLNWLHVGDRRWAISVLNIVLKHKPDSHSLIQAVGSHLDWIVVKEAGLGSLCDGLVTTIGGDDVVKIVSRILDRGERFNWRHLLAVVSITCDTCPSVVPAWRDVITELMTRAVEEENTDSLITCLVLARHVARVTGVPSYCSWFSSTFSDDTCMGSSGRGGCQFLVSSLTQLVPDEPLSVLRAHLSSK